MSAGGWKPEGADLLRLNNPSKFESFISFGDKTAQLRKGKISLDFL